MFSDETSSSAAVVISFSNFLLSNLFSWNLLFYFYSGFSYLSTQFLCLLKRLNLVQSWIFWFTVHHVFEFLFLYFFRCCESWWFWNKLKYTNCHRLHVSQITSWYSVVTQIKEVQDYIFMWYPWMYSSGYFCHYYFV